MLFIILPLSGYIGLLISSLLGKFYTGFKPPRGLWRLVPFRVSGWRSIFDDNKVYKINWIWQNINFENYYMEEKNVKV